MNKNIENKVRLKIRKLVESILKEESPMVPADDFKPKPVQASKPVQIGKMSITVERGSVFIKKGSSNLQMSIDEANKIANYLIRVSGKV